jgi:hypothetical protein
MRGIIRVYLGHENNRWQLYSSGTVLGYEF